MTKVKELILKKRPIVVNIQSAVHLGLNEAIVLQQIHYWIDSNEEREIEHVYKQGKWWTYGTYEEWQKRDFPFWSVSTVKRAFLSLQRKGAIESATHNKFAGDRTKWYSLNYDANIDPVNVGEGQIDPMVTDQDEPMGEVKLTHSNNKETKGKRKTKKETTPPNGVVPAVTDSVPAQKPIKAKATKQDLLWDAIEDTTHHPARLDKLSAGQVGQIKKKCVELGITPERVPGLFQHVDDKMKGWDVKSYTAGAIIKHAHTYNDDEPLLTEAQMNAMLAQYERTSRND